ncbi:hypothetical protein N7445_000922 [Penicillium cf. griseofulvum]|nr:hypothetical protein N7445_000922 [Penicillium cf. griseofulvum]
MTFQSFKPPPPPPPPPPPKNARCAAIKKEKRGGANQIAGTRAQAIRVMRETAETLEDKRSPHTQVKKGWGVHTKREEGDLVDGGEGAAVQ